MKVWHFLCSFWIVIHWVMLFFVILYSQTFCLFGKLVHFFKCWLYYFIVRTYTLSLGFLRCWRLWKLWFCELKVLKFNVIQDFYNFVCVLCFSSKAIQSKIFEILFMFCVPFQRQLLFATLHSIYKLWQCDSMVMKGFNVLTWIIEIGVLIFLDSPWNKSIILPLHKGRSWWWSK